MHNKSTGRAEPSSMNTTAHTVAAQLGNNGMIFDGLREACEAAGASVEYSQRVGVAEDGRPIYKAGWIGHHLSDDPVRYVFADGSAIVTAGDGWDIEGKDPFSWMNE